MQPTALNALAAIVAAPATQATGASANEGDEGALNQQFSQLLSDSGKQYDGQQASQQSAAKMLQGSAATALSAQEVTSPAEQLAQLLTAREQMISPDDAKDLLKRIDKMMEQGGDTVETQALSQIKGQLQTIITSGTPKSIAEILAAAPAVKEAKFSLVGLTALLTPKKAPTTASSEQEDDAGEESPAVATQAVPVMVFRPDAGETAKNTSAAKSDTKKESMKAEDKDKNDVADVVATVVNDTVTVIVPLAMPVVQAVAVPVANTVASSAPVSMDIGIKDIVPPAALKPRADIDQAIPPLSMNDGDDVLPEVNLPKAAAAEAATDKAGAGSFQSLAAAAGAVDAAKLDDKSMGVKAPTDLSALNTITHPAGATHTQTASAVQPVSVIHTPGYTNHAPVSDQVSVAVTKASKDGIDHITIQLDPAGLGRVEVNMHTNRDGHTQISFTVDKADTFDNLSRDARSLERSLQEAGIKADTGSMQFNMRQQPQQQLHSDMGQGQRPQQQANADDPSQPVASNVASVAVPTNTRNYLFNVREGVDISA